MYDSGHGSEHGIQIEWFKQAAHVFLHLMVRSLYSQMLEMASEKEPRSGGSFHVPNNHASKTGELRKIQPITT